MKLPKFASLIASVCVLSLAGTGCKKTPTKVTALPDYPHTRGSFADMPPSPAFSDGFKLNEFSDTNAPTAHPFGEPLDYDKYQRDTEMFKANTVHFDFDSSVIKAPEKPKVAAVAEYLKSNAAQALEIAGHADERGTEEYNRALGERRALALREELIRLGVEPVRLDTKTFGKDRPADPGHDEGAHRKNRRDEIVLLTPRS